MYANQHSEIPDRDRDAEAQNLDPEVERHRIYHRDGTWKIFARICATISVFCYQGVVFYA